MGYLLTDIYNIRYYDKNDFIVISDSSYEHILNNFNNYKYFVDNNYYCKFLDYSDRQMTYNNTKIIPYSKYKEMTNGNK